MNENNDFTNEYDQYDLYDTGLSGGDDGTGSTGTGITLEDTGYYSEEFARSGSSDEGSGDIGSDEDGPADSGSDAQPEKGGRPPESPRKRAWGFFLLGVLTAIVILGAVTWVFRDKIQLIPGEKLQYYQDLDSAYGKYYEALQLIGTDPIVDFEPSEISDADFKKLIEGVGDPYAQYFTADEYEAFLNSFIGNYVGVGIGVVSVDGVITIKSVFSNGSAAEAGIEMNDVILRVDGKEPGSVEDAVNMITGEAGTSVTLTVLRDGKELEFTMDRVELDQESVVYYELEDAEGVGYIGILSFVKETDEDFKLAVKDLEKQGCDKIIIDLRDNGGGLTDSSIEVADYLLPACTVMTDVLKDGTETVYSSDASCVDVDYVVLVNEFTASASEILTAAIQDNRGGRIIGSKTYGKGVTQSVHRFSDGSALKYTISEYYRPNGDKVQGIGITPDVEISRDEEDYQQKIIDTAVKELEEMED